MTNNAGRHRTSFISLSLFEHRRLGKSDYRKSTRRNNMESLKISFVDNDFATQAKTDLDVDNKQKQVLLDFFEQVEEELVTGQTARLEIEGLKGGLYTFTIEGTA